MTYLCHTSNSIHSRILINKILAWRSQLCVTCMAIQNYNSNYMNKCSIITIIIIKIRIKYCLLRFKLAINGTYGTITYMYLGLLHVGVSKRNKIRV